MAFSETSSPRCGRNENKSKPVVTPKGCVSTRAHPVIKQCSSAMEVRLQEHDDPEAKTLLPPAPAVQLLFTPVVEMSLGSCVVVAIDTAAVQLG